MVDDDLSKTSRDRSFCLVRDFGSSKGIGDPVNRLDLACDLGRTGLQNRVLLTKQKENEVPL